MERIIAGLMFLLPIIGIVAAMYVFVHVADVVIVHIDQAIERRKQR